MQYYSAIDEDSVADPMYHDPSIWVNVAARYYFRENFTSKLTIRNLFQNETETAGYNVQLPQFAIAPVGKTTVYLEFDLKV